MIPRRKKNGVNQFECLPGCGECCTPIPFEEPFYTQNEKSIVNPPHHVDAVDMGDGVIKCLPITENFRCCFLHPETQKCSIYSKRPTVCKEYGKTNRLPCKYVNKLGVRRTPQEVEEWGEISRTINENARFQQKLLGVVPKTVGTWEVNKRDKT